MTNLQNTPGRYCLSIIFMIVCSVLPTAISAQGRIAFTSNEGGNNNIWLMNSDGMNKIKLTQDLASDAYPNLARNGSKIAFVSERNGNQEIYTMNTVGSFQQRLTNHAAQDNSPVYSPDGSKIVFTSNRAGNYDIYIMDANGSPPVQLTTSTLDDGQPTFSHNGQKIFFVRLAANQTDSHIWSMNVDGSMPMQVTTGSFVLNGQPNMSIDGSKIVFSSVRPLSHTDPEIYIMNSDGTGQTRITTASGQDLDPVFSPDGSKIVFRSERTGSAEVFVMNADGASPQRLTVSGAGVINFAPSWSNVDLITATVPNNLGAEENTTLIVPITVSDTSGKGVLSYDFTFNFNPAVLQPQPIPYDKAGTLSSNFTVNTGTGTGTLVVSGYGSAPLSGAGVLVNLKFNVVGIAPISSQLTLNPFTFNEGIPFVEVVGGQVFIQGTIQGTVRYGTSATTVGVPGVTLSGAGSPNVSTTTASNGTYKLAGFGNGAYTVTPAKTGQVNGILAFDASLISQYRVGTTQLSANQLIAAEVSGDGNVTSFDAALIARYAVQLPNTGNAGAWVFVPASRSYVTVSNMIGENYDAILIGELSGDWDPSGPALHSFSSLETKGLEPLLSLSGGRSGGRSPELSIGQIRATTGQTLAIPVSMTYPGGTPALQAYQFNVSYDPTVVVPDGAGADLTSTLSSSFSVVTNPTTPGILRIAVFGAGSITSSGTLLTLRFRVVGERNSTSTLAIGQLILNEGNPGATVKNGSVSVRR